MEIQLELFTQQFKDLERRQELTFLAHNTLTNYKYLAVCIEGNLSKQHIAFETVITVLPIIADICYLLGYTTTKYAKVSRELWTKRAVYSPQYVPYGERSQADLYEASDKYKSGSKSLIMRIRGILLPGEVELREKVDEFETFLDDITYSLS